MFSKVKIFFIISLFILIIIPTSFAFDEGDNLDISSNEYYFNSSALDDGDGSVNNPYKNLENNLKANSVNYFANGEYYLGEDVVFSDVSFIGSDMNKTIIKCNGGLINVSKSLILKNITLVDFTIENNGNINATDTIFTGGFANSQDDYMNSYGGAIYTPYSEKNLTVSINNCIFYDNYAVYGGAIYMDGGVLNIVNSNFLNNTAYSYGGAIACEYGTTVNITGTDFKNDKSISDAGGAIYLKIADFYCSNNNFINCSSIFGGAICLLDTTSKINYIKCYNNSALNDGGVIYNIYGDFSISQANLVNNSAYNGGALYIGSASQMHLSGNRFEFNCATNCGGAIYSISNSEITVESRHFKDNVAFIGNDLYETPIINISEIGSGNYSIIINNNSTFTSIPDYYNLADYNYVSSIKNQQSGGNCWAFSTLSALESCILKASGIEFDLSEENMKNLIELYSLYGWKMDTNGGGYNDMGISYLISWLGPVAENSDVYDDHSTLSSLLNSLLHVQNVLFLKRDNFTDNNPIKEAILRYGGVATGIYYDSDYLRNNSYYYKGSSYSNHAVTIVGWDDNYSKDNFARSPNGDGAWIVKNSWGDSWGDNGYFYVSYYDNRLAQVGVEESSFTFILNDSMRYSKNYQYDIIGKTNYFANNNGEIWYKNIFKSTDNEFLAGVSTYFEKMSNWNLFIYVNNELKHMQSGVSNSGYYTIKLDNLIPLNLGDVFEVKFKISGNESYKLPISEVSYTNMFLSNSNISFFSRDGENWFDLYASVSPSVASIKAFTILNKINTNIIFNITNNQFNPVDIMVHVIDEYGNIINDGNITYTIENINYTVLINNGSAKLTYNFTDSGLNTINVIYNGGVYYNNCNDSFRLNVLKNNVSISLNILKDLNNININLALNNTLNGKLILQFNNKTYYPILINGLASFNMSNLDYGNYILSASYNDYNFEGVNTSNININIHKTNVISDNFITCFKSNALYSIRLVDEFKNPISNKYITFTIQGKNYTNITNNSGFATIPVNFANGDYPIRIIFDGDENYMKSTNTSKITVMSRLIENKNINMYYGAGNTYKLRVLDDYGKAVNEGEIVKFIISGKTKYIKTDKNGYVSFKINLNPSTYIITAEYKNFKVSNKIIIKPTLIVKNISKKKSKKIKFSAKLVSTKGKILKGKKITFKVKGKKYTAKTNKKGIASITIRNLKVGKYKITTNYGKLTVKNKITIK